MPLQSSPQTTCHLGRPNRVLSSVAEKQRPCEPFDFDWRCRKEVVRRSAPCPRSSRRVPRLPSGVSGIPPHPRIERSTDDIGRAMHCNRIGESWDAIPSHERWHQQGMFGTARNSIETDLLSGKAGRAESNECLDGSVERHVSDIPRVPAIPSIRIAERYREKAMGGENCGGPMGPSRPFPSLPVQKQNRRKRAISGRTITPSAVRQ